MPKIPSAEREILYPQVEARIFEANGDLLDADSAKEILGWTEPDEGEVFTEYHIKDIHKRTIYLSNVDLQRPYYPTLASDLMWDILAGNWQFNLETVIIGRTGLVLDGKHRLIALALANQEFERNPDRYPFWETNPTLEILIALGAQETKQLANTIGTGKPRSLADSFYASGLFDHKEDAKHMRKLCRMAEHSVRMLWTRTGAKTEAYNTRFSHSDALNFIERHGRLLHCIRTIHEENNGKDRRIDDVAGAYAPALLYLMSISDSDPELYRKADPPTEDLLDFGNEERAEDYWLKIAQRDKSVHAVTDLIFEMADAGNMRADERSAILIKGWNAFVEKGKAFRRDIEVEVDVDEHGHRRLIEDPIIDGIDVGFFSYEETLEEV